MEKGMIEILEDLPRFQNRIHELKESILANLIIIGELPSPTFQETLRVEFLVNRYAELGLQNCSTDEVGNALGILPGTRGAHNILLVSHVDSDYDESVDHTVSVQQTSVSGPAIGDNALGAAALATLPLILDRLGIELQNNLVLMGSTRSLGRGDIAGSRFFLANSGLPFSHGVCIEGVMLGNLSYSSVGLMRCEISYEVPEEYDWTRFGTSSAIATMNEVINRILEIPVPRRPRTSIRLRSIRGGAGYDTFATEATLRFEIQSESAEMVASLSSRINEMIKEVSSNSGGEISMRIFAQRKPGGIEFTHPLVEHAREILNVLDVPPRISPSTSDLSAFIDRGIPAIEIGLTNVEEIGKLNERIAIEPIYTGLAQLVGLILAIDRGYCDEPE